MSHSHTEVCHLWASGNKASAKGFNIYFEGRNLYSYGTHYLLGFRMSAATFFLNSRRYSPSTGKHQSYAWRAAHGRIFHIPDMTAHRHELETISRYANASKAEKRERKASAQQAAESMIHKLTSAMSESADVWNDKVERAALEALAEYADIAPGKAARMIDSGVKAAAARVERDAKRRAKAARSLAVRYAKIPDSRWQAAFNADVAALRMAGTDYDRRNALRAIENAALEAVRHHRVASREGLAKATVARIWARVKANRAVLADYKANAEKREFLGKFRANKLGLRASLAAFENPSPNGLFGAWDAITRQVAVLTQSRHVTGDLATRLHALGNRAHAEAQEEARKAAALEAARQAEKVKLWRAGEYVPGFYCPSQHGGAMIRAVEVERDDFDTIIGGTLETSQGARVPLTHAIRAFRFLKLCREQSRPWQRNGKTIRVGHYTVDSINPDGGFTAGCHRFAWAEIEALAVALGVFALPAADDAVTPTVAA